MGGTAIRGCIACEKCFQNQDNECAVKKDKFNDIFSKMLKAHAMILGSPHFTGQLDETSSIGLYFFNARFYAPVLGRFSSADSLIPEPGNPQAWDRFARMYNNPVRFLDPTGHGVDCGIWELNCKSSLKQIKEHNKKTLTAITK